MERMYTTVEACTILGIKVRTMRDWISKGKIKAQKYGVSNRWFIAESEIERIKNNEK